MAEDRKIWVGCLGCYNAGALVGSWMSPADYDPDDPVASIPRLVSREAEYDGKPYTQIVCGRCGSDDCNRWVFDHEYFGGAIKGEDTADRFHQVDALLTAIEEDIQDVPVAVVVEFFTDGGQLPEEWDAPSSEAFREAYAGSFKDNKAYAYDHIENYGWAGVYPIPEGLDAVLDYDLIARDLRAEMSVIEHDGNRYYFRSV